MIQAMVYLAMGHQQMVLTAITVFEVTGPRVTEVEVTECNIVVDFTATGPKPIATELEVMESEVTETEAMEPKPMGLTAMEPKPTGLTAMEPKPMELTLMEPTAMELKPTELKAMEPKPMGP